MEYSYVVIIRITELPTAVRPWLAKWARAKQYCSHDRASLAYWAKRNQIVVL